ncbi:MAG: LacI family transcriptional regulator [Thermoanaerobacteraceae bacterium]|nr:LacI family transcriptional regulator [Thermoanaerobacteraceae bacterium]
MATLNEIAKRAQVSVSTVSKFINNKGRFSPATEERIKEALVFFNYYGKETRSKKKVLNLNMIGLIIPDIENPFFSSLTKTLEMVFFRYGYSILLCNTESNLELESNFLQYLNNKGLDGLVLVPANSAERTLPFFATTPIILLDRRIDGLDFPFVSVNNYKGAQMAVSYLLQLGKKNIAFISTNKNNSASRERFNGYQSELSKHGVNLCEGLIVEGDFSYQSGYKAIDQLLENGEKFDAVFASNDLMALGAMERLKEKGFGIPEEVGIIGFDDIWLSKIVHPPLTTVRQPLHELCKTAAEILLSIKNKPTHQKIEKILEPELTIRGSC